MVLIQKNGILYTPHSDSSIINSALCVCCALTSWCESESSIAPSTQHTHTHIARLIHISWFLCFIRIAHTHTVVSDLWFTLFIYSLHRINNGETPEYKNCAVATMKTTSIWWIPSTFVNIFLFVSLTQRWFDLIFHKFCSGIFHSSKMFK